MTGTHAYREPGQYPSKHCSPVCHQTPTRTRPVGLHGRIQFKCLATTAQQHVRQTDHTQLLTNELTALEQRDVLVFDKIIITSIQFTLFNTTAIN